MNKDIFHGDWNVLKGKIKEKWGKLSDDDLTAVQGKRDQLLGAIQKRYGIAKDKAHAELSAFEKTFDTDTQNTKNLNKQDNGNDFTGKDFIGKGHTDGHDQGKTQAGKGTFGKGEISKGSDELETEEGHGNRGGQPKKTQKF